MFFFFDGELAKDRSDLRAFIVQMKLLESRYLSPDCDKCFEHVVILGFLILGAKLFADMALMPSSGTNRAWTQYTNYVSG
jgi:hypothetical protein